MLPAGAWHAVKSDAVGIENELAVRIGPMLAVEGMEPDVGVARGVVREDSAEAGGPPVFAALGRHAVEHAADGHEATMRLVAVVVLGARGKIEQRRRVVG